MRPNKLIATDVTHSEIEHVSEREREREQTGERASKNLKWSLTPKLYCHYSLLVLLLETHLAVIYAFV